MPNKSYFWSGLLLCGVAFLVGCDDRVTVEPPRPVHAPISANARLVLSDSGARAGDLVAISAYGVTTEKSGGVGSFTARLLYDTLQLRVEDVDQLNDGALRAHNPIDGEYRLAGAHAQGIPDGLLFRVKARVIDPKGLRRIALAVDELHSVQLVDVTQQVLVQDGRVELLGNTPGLRVQPNSPSVVKQ